VKQQNTGALIAKKRKEKNLTQEQLAERLQVSNKTVSKWENGKCMPDYSIIELLCKELDITISELLEGKVSNSAEKPDDEKYQMLLYKVEQVEQEIKMKHDAKANIRTGISLGSALAMIISYVNWHSIGWAIVHGLLSWGYVIYYLIKY